MKESVGATASLYIILFFTVIMFGFILSIFSYYKSFKINNIITSTIEDAGSFNSNTYKDINQKLKTYGYDINNTNNNCSLTNNGGSLLAINTDGNVTEAKNSEDTGYYGYCVYILDDTPDNSLPEYAYYHYEIITYMNLSIMNYKVIKVPVKTKTSTMYSCYNMEDCMSSGGI